MTPSLLLSSSAAVATPATVPSSDRRVGRFAGLDGLRAIAVLAVILFHLTPGAVPGGYLGVDVFFVISGFLITGLLLRERQSTGRIRLGAFWMRRARRLLPALALVVVSGSALALVLGGDVLVHLGRQVLGATTFSSNWLSIGAGQSYFDGTTPELFRNLWSLAVEEQFYLVWPLAMLVLLLVPSGRLRIGLVVALAVASAAAMWLIYLPGADATRVYYGTDTHCFGLAIGAAIAILLNEAPERLATLARRRFAAMIGAAFGAAAIVALCALAVSMPASAPFVYRGGLIGVALLTAVAILGSIGTGSVLGRVLDSAPLRWIGERSYGLYLWHWPVFVLVVAALPGWQRTGGDGWAMGAVALVITVGVSVASYRFVERPIRLNGFRATLRAWTSGWRASAPRLVAALAAVAIALVAVGASVAAIASDPGKTSSQVAVEQGERSIDSHRSPDATGGPTPGRPPAALPGGDQITAIGDSVMLASAPELQSTFPGIQIDAVVSRQLSSVPSILQGMVAAGTLRPTVLIGLGTNGPIDRSTLDAVRTIAGSAHDIVMINVQAPRGWTDGVNSTLSRFAQQYRDVELANWRDAIAGHLDLLARDQIHPGSAGGAIYARAVTDALQRLAELPPALGPNDFGLASIPL
ncbi:acyltransferase family protein [Lacisediminihabitans profunda]|uniref:Acetyltransferase n=1 Tax=Lacisediminihabitans profunda TaxID=2594790 RepID=A0A5C8UPP5_9MICO|nr:acyltransferase family protein [Lacisediminihabitans profunda]TXN30264.1 acetyltransferase [Lacisediminihabitans profunda]